jgi:hypothetical protein
VTIREGVLAAAREDVPGKRVAPKRHPSRWRRLRAHPRWPWIARGAALAFFALVATLLIVEARNVRWQEVIDAIRRMPWPTLMVAMGLVCASHLLYSCYDLVGRLYTGHKLSRLTVLAVTFVSYAFNLNMGALVGGAGIRFRLYLQLGLGVDVVARILSLAMLSNWLGYMLLAGIVLLMHPVALPFDWTRLGGVVDVIGVVLILVPASYLAACAFSRRRVVQTARAPARAAVGADRRAAAAGVVRQLARHGRHHLHAAPTARGIPGRADRAPRRGRSRRDLACAGRDRRAGGSVRSSLVRPGGERGIARGAAHLSGDLLPAAADGRRRDVLRVRGADEVQTRAHRGLRAKGFARVLLQRPLGAAYVGHQGDVLTASG